MIRPIYATRQLSLSESNLERTLYRRQSVQAQLQEHLSTGLRVNRASDDSSAFGLARRMEILSNRYEQYLSSITAAQPWIDQTQDALDDLAELLTQTHEKAVQGANDTISQDDRNVLAENIESFMQSVLDQLNTKHDGEYIFAGTNSTTPPFAQDFGGTSDAAGFSYFGNNAGRTRAVGPEFNLDINITGARVFDTGSGFTITESMQEMADALRTGDAVQIETAMDRVITARDHVLHLGTEAGTLANRLIHTESQLRDSILLFEGRRSEAEEADMAKTIVQIEKNQVGLQGTLRAISSLKQMTLLDFLR